MLMERGGTGGALFRAMYRDFLAELADGERRAMEVLSGVRTDLGFRGVPPRT